MTGRQILKKIEEKHIIAAVKDDEGLEKVLNTDTKVVFVLYGDIMTIGTIVKKIRDAGKAAIVHVDLVTGLSAKEVSVDFIKQSVHADGIISTKQAVVKHAKEIGMFTIMRFFVLDSMALVNLSHQCRLVQPDCIEILPGLMPKIIKKVASEEKIPLIAGGLISDLEDIENAINAGAVAVSSTNEVVWE